VEPNACLIYMLSIHINIGSQFILYKLEAKGPMYQLASIGEFHLPTRSTELGLLEHCIKYLLSLDVSIFNYTLCFFL